MHAMTLKKGDNCCAWRLQNCNRSHSSRSQALNPALSDGAVGPLSGRLFFHQRLKHCADALARLAPRGAPQRRFPGGMPARRCRRRPYPLPSRCARPAFLSSVPIKSTKRGQARSPRAQQPAAPHPRDRDARHPAPPPRPTVRRPPKSLFSADQEGGAKNGSKNGPDRPRRTKCMSRTVAKLIFLFI
jgi:hypothetical protein